MKKLVALLLSCTMATSIALVGCGSDSSDYGDLEWPTSGLAAMLPTPESTVGEITENSDEKFKAEVAEVSADEFSEYVEACKDLGFTIDATDQDEYYSAGYEGGYDLTLEYREDDEYFKVTLEAPEELSELSWPTVGLATLIPTPSSTVGKIKIDSSIQFSALIQCTSIDEYNTYVAACQDAGFVVDYASYDTYYSAYDADGYSLRIDYTEYKGYYVISMDAPDDVEESAETTETETTETETTETETTETETTDDTSSGSGISEDFQEAMDSYEAFIDEYVAFMETYANSDDTTELLSEYSEYVTKLSEFSEEFDDIADQDLTDEELAYYAEVQLRVSEKLLSVEY